MWRRKKHYSVMGMDMDMDHLNMRGVKTVATAVVAGIAIYQAAKYMFREMMD
ncbi:hypothetical protein [Dendrosporobacter sp. 1207_IL3150]|uniref:hypothetical protein n=1 Tax=Dendrosporobacter sp. 1207_IL3150 TaxID=3084054 RepID=UPI002FD98928